MNTLSVKTSCPSGRIEEVSDYEDMTTLSLTRVGIAYLLDEIDNY